MTPSDNESIGGEGDGEGDGGGGGASVSVSLSDQLRRFHQSYASVHGYVSLFVCVAGVLSNAFIVIVLRQRSMMSTTNLILTALAVSDMVTMITYIPFALQFYCLHGTHASPHRNTINWMRFVLLHAHLSVTAHTVSIWLGVLLSVFRYSFVRATASGDVTASFSTRIRTTQMAIACVVMASVFCLVPNYLSLTIHQFPFPPPKPYTPNHPTDHDYVTTAPTLHADDVTPTAGDVIIGDVIIMGNRSGLEDRDLKGMDRLEQLKEGSFIYEVVAVDAVNRDGYGRLITQLNFWIHALMIKFLPCALMFIFGLRIVCAVRSSHRASARLRSNSTRTDTRLLRQREHNRTTSMLVVVIVLFLVTELPQGILALMSGVIGGRFFEMYYAPLGDLMDIMALVNNGINFTLYCTMSNKFRQTFVRLFCPFSRRSKRGRGGRGEDGGGGCGGVATVTGGPFSGHQELIQQTMPNTPTEEEEA